MIRKWFPLMMAVILCSKTILGQEPENSSHLSAENLVMTSVALADPAESWQPCISPFVELLGKGFLSLNVDFRRKESHAVSLGLMPFEGLAPDIMYYYLGGQRHRLEIGTGFTTGFNQDIHLSAIILHGVIGYRYQQKKGIFFRIGFTPFYVIWMDDRNYLYPSAGLSLGYSF